MAYHENIVNRVRERLADLDLPVTEKSMFQGFGFMVDDKLCVAVRDDELMCRIDTECIGEVLEKGHCRQMVHGGKAMKGYVFVEPEGYKTAADFEYWIKLCLDYNKKVKPAKKRK